MHWSEEIAQRIIDRNPNKEEYVCAAGISPSGSVHIGNFRDVATSWFVVKALRKKGKKARLLFSWDEYDRCRKIPANVQALVGDSYNHYIGCPYSDMPDPWGCHESYAKHFEAEFLDTMKQFGIELDKKRIVQSEPIKQYGSYELKCKLGSEVSATLKLTVEEE